MVAAGAEPGLNLSKGSKSLKLLELQLRRAVSPATVMTQRVGAPSQVVPQRRTRVRGTGT